MSLPKEGEINFRRIPEKRYHAMTKPGPDYPMISDSFLENKMISSIGFVKLE